MIVYIEEHDGCGRWDDPIWETHFVDTKKLTPEYQKAVEKALKLQKAGSNERAFVSATDSLSSGHHYGGRNLEKAKVDFPCLVSAMVEICVRRPTKKEIMKGD